MRLLIKLQSRVKNRILFLYYLQIQGLIYNLLKDTKFAKLHHKKSYKFFCFSNLFSEKNLSPPFFKKNINNLIISSPNKDFLKVLARGLITKKKIKIGDVQFDLRGMNFFNVSAKAPFKIISVSPIIIRIPKEKYQQYSISSNYPYFFWRPKYPFEAFIKQLEDNIFKKYKEYYGREIEEFPIFQKFFFKKSVSLPP